MRLVEAPMDLWRAIGAYVPPQRPWKLHMPGTRTRSYGTLWRAEKAAKTLRGRGWIVDGPSFEPRGRR